MDSVFPTDQQALLPLAMDVTDEVQIEPAVRNGINRFGRIDVLVNNAIRADFDRRF
jgi:NADP-dependent 3-hydroxy acid dehydrogenase YdfG